MKKTCKDCKNYIKHYAISKKAGLTEANCGHCKMIGANKNFRSTDNICESFTPSSEILTQQQKETDIVKTIQSIESKLERLLLFVEH